MRKYGVLVELTTHVRVYVEAESAKKARDIVDGRINAEDLGEGTFGLPECFEDIPVGEWDWARTLGDMTTEVTE